MRIWLGSDRIEAEQKRLALVNGEPAKSQSISLTLAEVFEIFWRWAKTRYTDSRTVARIKTAIWFAVDVAGEMGAEPPVE